MGGIRMEPGFILGGLVGHGLFCSSETEEDRAKVVLQCFRSVEVLLDPFRVFGKFELLEALSASSSCRAKLSLSGSPSAAFRRSSTRCSAALISSLRQTF